MKKILLSLFAIGSLFASNHAQWGYTGEYGPSHWGDLKSEYKMCKIGKNQSPINITNEIKANLQPLKLEYNVKAYEFLNNGHTLKAKMKKGATLYIDGKKFNLLQFHFHTPSENTINGKHFPMEAHFVHSSKNGELAVISLMFQNGKYNATMQKLINNMPKHAGNYKNICKANLKAKDLLPKKLDYYRFNGSLTTPPCSEGVRWFVLKTPVEMSETQIKEFEKIMHKNNRPIQPINARIILK